jgi:hypothetical protein
VRRSEDVFKRRRDDVRGGRDGRKTNVGESLMGGTTGIRGINTRKREAILGTGRAEKTVKDEDEVRAMTLGTGAGQVLALRIVHRLHSCSRFL